MEKSKKKLIIGIISIVLIAIITIIAIKYINPKNEEDDEIKIIENDEPVVVKEKDVPENISSEKIFGDIKIKDIDIYAIEGATIFKAKVENISDKLMKEKAVTIIFKGENGEECDKIKYPIELLRTGEYIEIDYFITKDITKIKDIVAEISDDNS